MASARRPSPAGRWWQVASARSARRRCACARHARVREGRLALALSRWCSSFSLGGGRRRPTRRQTVSESSSYRGLDARGADDHTAQLALRKAAQDGNTTIVPRDRMKAQHRRGERESRGRDPAPPQIADDDPAPRDAIELGDEREAAIVIEVVKELGAEHEIDAAIGKGEGKGIATDGVVHAMARGSDQTERTVDGYRSQRQATTTRDLARAPGEIGAPRTDIEQRRLGPPGSRR